MRLVDADKYKEELLSGYMAATTENDERAVAAYEDALGCLDSTPTIEAEPVVHAYWVPDRFQDDMYYSFYHCSRCGRQTSVNTGFDINKVNPYCNCGAKIDEIGEWVLE